MMGDVLNGRKYFSNDVLTLQEEMIGILSRPGKYQPDNILIGPFLARDIIREYGELNMDTFEKYRNAHGQ